MNRLQTNSGSRKKGMRQRFMLLGIFVRRHKLLSAIAAVVFVLIIAGLTTLILVLTHKKDDMPISSNPAVLAYQNQLPDLEKAVKQNDKSESAHRNYAVALYATGEYKQAIDQYNKAIAINGNDASAYNNLANAYRDDNQIDKAVEAYNKAISVDKTYINAYANLANVQLYTQNDSAAAIATYQKGIENNPNNSQLEILLGVAYERANDKTSANQTYRHILTYDPQNTAATAGVSRTAN